MASLIAYTKKSLIERIKKHIADGFPSNEFTTTDNEVLLYIDQAAAFNLIGQVYGNAKIEGSLATPEAYLTTYELPALLQDSVSGYWYTTLPQPPVNLPLGYSINRVFFGSDGTGQSRECLPIKAKRVGYRVNLPMPEGARYWVENSRIWVAASDGQALSNQTLFTQMAKTRTESITETLALPDDAIEAIFNSVVGKLIQRMQLPKDVIVDGIGAGNKTS